MTESAASSRRSLELSTIQYREGAVDFLRVDIAAANVTEQEDTQASIEGLVASNLIGAYKALGGGWELRVGNEFVPQATVEEMRKRTDWGNVLDADYSRRKDLGFQRPGDDDETHLDPEAKSGTR